MFRIARISIRRDSRLGELTVTAHVRVSRFGISGSTKGRLGRHHTVSARRGEDQAGASEAVAQDRGQEKVVSA